MTITLTQEGAMALMSLVIAGQSLVITTLLLAKGKAKKLKEAKHEL